MQVKKAVATADRDQWGGGAYRLELFTVVPGVAKLWIGPLLEAGV